MFRRPVSWRLLLGLPIALVPTGEAIAAALTAPVQRLAGALRKEWNADPLSRGWPFPQLELLEPGRRALAVCPEARGLGATAETSALFCPTSGRVLLDPKWLQEDVKRDGEWALAYWIATGLAQAIRQRAALPAPALSGAAANLQVNCLAGLLLQNQRPGPSAGRAIPWHRPAFKAYPAGASRAQGTPAQRSYAFLSGIGVARGDCSSRAMAALGDGDAADPELLQQLGEDPTSRARAVQRQQSPEALVPRGLSAGLGI